MNNAEKRGGIQALSLSAAVTWARQMMLVMADGGLVDANGRRIYTPAQRWGLAAAAYFEGWAALHDKDAALLFDTAPLQERLDQAASESLELLLAELSEPEVAGLATFWILTMSKAGQRFRQSSGKTGKGSN